MAKRVRRGTMFRMRFASRAALFERIEREHAALLESARAIERARYRESGAWGDDWTVTDLFTHLSEWHRLLLGWMDEGQAGRTPHLPAPGYTWRETAKLNRDLQRRRARTTAARALREFDQTHAEVLARLRGLSEAELLEPGHWSWTGRLPLASYVAPNTCSHYAAARKILARFKRRGATRTKRAR